MPDIRLLELRNTYKWGGGPDKTILLSAQRHDQARVSVVVGYIRDVRDREFRIAEQARSRGLNFYEIEERGKFDLRVLRAIRDLVIRHDINLIHAHDYKSDLFAYLIQRWMRPRRVALLSTAHAWVMLGLRGAFYRRLDLFLMKRFDALIAVSHATKEEMMSAGVPPAKINVIHNAIDTEVWARAQVSTDLREELGIAGAFPVIGYVGRIDPEKDLDTWLHAAVAATGQFPKARFVLAGEGRDGTTQAHLRRLAETLGVADRVIFSGYQSHLLPTYAAFDIFLFTSRREGLPNSILEAMAMGLPVVTTDVAGAKELVDHGQTGFVLPQGDVRGLAEAVTALVNDAELRSRMGECGRRRVEHSFSFTKRLRSVEDLYEKTLGLTPPKKEHPTHVGTHLKEPGVS
ncbi:MAG: glycosyltransferase family 4 protein [Deltaproteobacteria bacterium]|nr:glycosyltransferase family 4 protein [Deltaproteobacteria bacterium]